MKEDLDADGSNHKNDVSGKLEVLQCLSLRWISHCDQSIVEDLSITVPEYSKHQSTSLRSPVKSGAGLVQHHYMVDDAHTKMNKEKHHDVD